MRGFEKRQDEDSKSQPLTGDPATQTTAGSQPTGPLPPELATSADIKPTETSATGDDGTPEPQETGGAAGPTGASKRAITFDSDNFSRGYVLQMEETKFQWDKNDTTTPTAVRLLGRDVSDTKFSEIGQKTFGTRKRQAADGKSQEAGKLIDLPSQDEATLKFDLFSDPDATDLQKWLGYIMVLQVDWRVDEFGSFGSSQTLPFSVVDPTDGQSQADANEEINRLRESNDGDVDPVETVSYIKDDGSTQTAGDTPINTNDSSPQPGSNDGGSDSDDGGSGGGGGGGLTTGAIAGIAVGGAAVIAIIVALVWFYLRKRNRKERDGSTYSGNQPPPAYIVDKESHAHVSEDPYTPFTDDGRAQTVPLAAGMHPQRSDTADTHDERSSLTRSHDHAPAGSSPVMAHSGRNTPHGVSSNVAHLVEEGMTEDEIRRLEEEERHLDDEILRAGRR